MKESYITVSQAAEAEYIEKKSRFIGYVQPVTQEDEALTFIQTIKKKHHDATHNCYAYQIGEYDQLQRSSDDGEPAGTAGRPILEVIKKSQLKNVAIVVTRYFGGILLGAGGLVRAYSKAAQLGIAAASMVRCISGVLYSVTVDYPLWGKLEHYLQQKNYQTQELLFLEKVTAHILLPIEMEAAFLKDMAELSNGVIQCMSLGEQILRQPVL